MSQPNLKLINFIETPSQRQMGKAQHRSLKLLHWELSLLLLSCVVSKSASLPRYSVNYCSCFLISAAELKKSRESRAEQVHLVQRESRRLDDKRVQRMKIEKKLNQMNKPNLEGSLRRMFHHNQTHHLVFASNDYLLGEFT